VTLYEGLSEFSWDNTQKVMYAWIPVLSGKIYGLLVEKQTGLPRIPAAGIARVEDLTNAKGVVTIPQFPETAASPSVYAYSRQTTRRNLYRIQLP
jgi:hypothetical protein